MNLHQSRLFSAAYFNSSNRRRPPSFPKVRPHAPDTIQTPPRDKLPLIGRIKQMLWAIGHRLAERDAKFAMKAGMAVAMLASPAFIGPTRPIFVEYWGEWALISVGLRLPSNSKLAVVDLNQCFVVLSPTIGAVSLLILLGEVPNNMSVIDKLSESSADPVYTVSVQVSCPNRIYIYIFIHSAQIGCRSRGWRVQSLPRSTSDFVYLWIPLFSPLFLPRVGSSPIYYGFPLHSPRL